MGKRFPCSRFSSSNREGNNDVLTLRPEADGLLFHAINQGNNRAADLLITWVKDDGDFAQAACVAGGVAMSYRWRRVSGMPDTPFFACLVATVW